MEKEKIECKNCCKCTSENCPHTNVDENTLYDLAELFKVFGDIIVANDDLNRFAFAHRLFRKTHKTVWFNIIFSIGIKILVLLLGAFGYAPIWLAVFADVGVCLICIAVSSMLGFDKFRH